MVGFVFIINLVYIYSVNGVLLSLSQERKLAFAALLEPNNIPGIRPIILAKCVIKETY